MSMFKYNWVPEDELKPQAIIFAEGEASYKIEKVKTIDEHGFALKTQKGDPKITLQLNIKDQNGTRGTLFQDITQNMPWMIKGLADSTGMPSLYNKQGLNLNAVLGLSGKCMIKNETNPGYDKAKSRVHYFMPYEDTNVVKTIENNTNLQNDSIDDIPF